MNLDESKSLVNEGNSQINRIEHALTQVHDLSMNILLRDKESGLYCYEALPRTYDIIFKEIATFLTEDEREYCLKLRELITLTLKVYPIYTLEVHARMGISEKRLTINRQNLERIQDLFLKHELNLRTLLSKYELTGIKTTDKDRIIK